MPTYFACGALDSPDPEDEERILDHSCGSCEGCAEDSYLESPYDDDDERGSYSSSAARDAAEYVNGLAEYETPVMYSPNLRREVSCEWEAAAGVQTARLALQDYLRNGASFEFHGDCTCDGELVFGRLDLSSREGAHRYGRSLAVLDKLRRENEVRVSFAAGHHIHVAARDENGRGISASNLVSLYSVFAHCEDLLYRLAAAGWSKHRCENDSTYSGPMYKLEGRPRTPRHVGNAIGGDKYQGLNVSPYIGNLHNCRCGAFRFGEWESCECPDYGATIEWRLWNGSISARKIRAYIAISAVLTDYAAKVDPRDCLDLEEHPFTRTGEVDEDSLARQLDYLITRPGFTKVDRQDIRWLVSFAPGLGNLTDLDPSYAPESVPQSQSLLV